jgi:ribulose-phosphate 3-epimerase
MIQITPSILVENEELFLRCVHALGDSVSTIQLDIADGVFVPNKTWADPQSVSTYLPMACELHLMVRDPLKELAKWAAVEQVVRVLVHVESTPKLADIFPTLHAYGWEIGLVLNPETPIDAITPFLSEIKRVMFMGVHPGQQGQAFIPETLDKIRAFKAKKTDHTIAIDGGVNEQTLRGLIAAGINVACPGSAIFQTSRTPSEAVAHMKNYILQLT